YEPASSSPTPPACVPSLAGCPYLWRMPLESSSSPMPLSFSLTLSTRRWSGPQSECFLQDLVAKAVPGKLQPLLEGLERLSVSGANRPPCIFERQLCLWDRWFRGWAEQELNEFVRQLEVSEPDFMAKFYQAVPAMAGKD
uniref:Uncharacterized protein n=1 Tax=Ailuropoda melanoleuca TaxID=9646 RepID=G1M199_AILME